MRFTFDPSKVFGIEFETTAASTSATATFHIVFDDLSFTAAGSGGASGTGADDACFELKRDGGIVEVEPRVFDFILYLIKHRARVVLKDELLNQVWKQSCISESALTRCACEARKALGDSSLIKTVRGRGYRWSHVLLALSDAGRGTEGD